MILFEDRAATVLYKVLKQTPSQRFLLPLNVCTIIPDTFLKANKEFEFIDINLETLCMDEDIVLQKINNDSSIDGVLFVKTFGIEFDIQPFYKKIKTLNKKIFIIDDMCACIPEFEYRIDQSYADMALFSTGYSKYIDIGYGGYGFLKDSKFNNIFQDKGKEITFLKYKNVILETMPKIRKHKQELNDIYKNNLPKELFLGERFDNWRFSLLVDNKNEILRQIFKIDGLFASSHYPQVDFNYSKNPIIDSNTKKIHNKILNLFNDFRFTKEMAFEVVNIIKDKL